MKNFLLGWIYVLVGTLWIWSSAQLGLGEAARMGPGYFPALVALVLVISGVVLIIKNWPRG